MSQLAVLDEPPPMPTRTFVDAEGRTMNLHDLTGDKVLLVNLWGTWCPQCVTEMPTLAALQRRFEGRPFQVVAISTDREAERDKAMAELARLSGGSLEFYLEPTRGILFDARAVGAPLTILYDRQGRELARLTGGADWASEEAAALVEAALAS